MEIINWQNFLNIQQRDKLGRFVKGLTPWNKKFKPNENEDKIFCSICGKKLVIVHWNHLRIHNISQQEYKKRFPNAQICNSRYSEISKKNGKELGNIWGTINLKKAWENPTEKMIENCREIGKKTWSINIKKINKETLVKNAKAMGKKYALINLRNLRKNYPYWFNNTPFDSNEERECAKYLLERKVIFNLQEGINCHIPIKKGEIDFLLKDKKFLEYHPWDRKNLTKEEYYNQRRKLLDENNFEDFELLVVQSLEELKKLFPPI